MKKGVLLSAILAVLALAFAAGCGGGRSAAAPPPAESGATVGRAAPVTSLPGLDGKQVSFPQAGTVTVVNFWATWCPPCREELPELDRFAREQAGNLAFFAVNIEEPADKVGGFLRQHGYSLPVLLDGNAAAARAWRISALPTTVVIDDKGIVRYRKSGPVTAAELAGVIKGL